MNDHISFLSLSPSISFFFQNFLQLLLFMLHQFSLSFYGCNFYCLCSLECFIFSLSFSLPMIFFNISKLWLHVWHINFSNAHNFIFNFIQELLLKIYLSRFINPLSRFFSSRVGVLINEMRISVHWLRMIYMIFLMIIWGSLWGSKDFRFSFFNWSESSTGKMLSVVLLQNSVDARSIANEFFVHVEVERFFLKLSVVLSLVEPFLTFSHFYFVKSEFFELVYHIYAVVGFLPFSFWGLEPLLAWSTDQLSINLSSD